MTDSRAAEWFPFTSTEEWLEIRARFNDVTASTIGALFGLHPHMTLAKLYALKAGLVTDDQKTNTAMRRGHALEEHVARVVAKMHPEWTVVHNDFYLHDPERRLGATPDYFIRKEGDEYGVLQIKTVSESAYRKHWADATPPTWIGLQAATEMMLANASFGVVAVMRVGEWAAFDEVELFDVPRHRRAEQRILDTVKAFWASVAADIEPSIDYERDADLIALLYPHETPGKTVDLSTDNSILDVLADRARLKAEIAVAERALKICDTEIKAKMGDAEIALLPDWRITLKTVDRKGFTVDPTSFRQLVCKRVDN